MSPSPRRILVIDTQPIMREGLVHFLTRSLDCVTVTASGNFPEAHARLRMETVDLVISDFRVAGETVVSFLGALRAEQCGSRCLVISDLNELEAGSLCLRAGACGFVKRSAPVEEIVNAVRQVFAGMTYFSEKLSRMLVSHPSRNMQYPSAMRLTGRELQIFTHLGEGLAVSTIAASLGISVKTVETHRENIKNKLGLQTAALVTLAAARWLDDTHMAI